MSLISENVIPGNHGKIFETNAKELEDLERDLIEFKNLEQASEGSYVEFWSALYVICHHEKLIREEKNRNQNLLQLEVLEVAHEMFDGQGVYELEGMKDDIQERLNNTGDVEYWKEILRHVDIYIAKAYAKEVNESILMKQMNLLEQRRSNVKSEATETSLNLESEPHEAHSQDLESLLQNKFNNFEEYNLSTDKREDYFASSNISSDTLLSEEDKRKQADNDISFSSTGPSDITPDTLSRPKYQYDEASVLLQDKYRPRKPRYFINKKDGFDLNKYNKTHYDRDNPPPKTVQGYKFVIFYPDLIDKSKVPQYKLEKADSKEFAIIRFTAGPPYEDIAFRIVNKEWERSKRHGFKSVFDKGFLTLSFNFKRAFYKR